MRHSGAPGSDGVTWAQYRVLLEERIAHLASRLATGTWSPSAVRHVALPSWGKDIALAIPIVEDRIVHRACEKPPSRCSAPMPTGVGSTGGDPAPVGSTPSDRLTLTWCPDAPGPLTSM